MRLSRNQTSRKELDSGSRSFGGLGTWAPRVFAQKKKPRIFPPRSPALAVPRVFCQFKNLLERRFGSRAGAHGRGAGDAHHCILNRAEGTYARAVRGQWISVGVVGTGG